MNISVATKWINKFRRSHQVCLVTCLMLVAGVSIAAVEMASNDARDIQVGQIASEVSNQLEKMDFSSSKKDIAVTNFTNSLKEVMDKPVTEDQRNTILNSLKDHGYYTLCFPYNDPTDTELKYCNLIWKDMIKAYINRKPVTSSDKELLNQQLDLLFETVQSAMNKSLDGQDNASIVKAIEYGRNLANSRADDPVIPAMKRLLTQAEIDEISSWLNDKITKFLDKWKANPEQKRGLDAFDVVTPIMTSLTTKIWRLQYTMPQLSPELMDSMRDERNVLFKKQQNSQLSNDK